MQKTTSRLPVPPKRSRWRWLLGPALVVALATACFALVNLSRDSGSPGAAPEGMVWIPGGWFWMGSDEAMGIDSVANSCPVHQVWVDGFWMDATETTNDQFAAFVRATGYKTVAERPPDAALLANALPEHRGRGPFSLVFSPPADGVGGGCRVQMQLDRRLLGLVEGRRGASWTHPDGPRSSIEDKGDYPVVHVCYEDALAYARWAGNACRPKPSGSEPRAGGLDRQALLG